MKSVTSIQTHDGVIHADERVARQHLDKAYSTAILGLMALFRKGECDIAEHAITGAPYAFVSGESRVRGRAVTFFNDNLDEIHRLVVEAYTAKLDMKMEESSDE